MGAASLAVFYTLFAGLFISLNLSTLNINKAWSLNDVVSRRIDTLPILGQGEPRKYMRDIEKPEDLPKWLNNVVGNVIYEEQKAAMAATGLLDPNMTGTGGTPAMVGSFNRILLLRFTAKRRQLKENKFGRFRAGSSVNSYPKLLMGNSLFEPSVLNDEEDRSAVCAPSGAPCLYWQEKESYNQAGGYSVFIDPIEGQQVFTDRVQQFVDAGIFNLRLSSFVLDFMVFNANADSFLHRGFVFQFDFAGNAIITDVVRGFSLNTYNTDKYLSNYILRMVLWVFIILFIIYEFTKVWNLGVYQHFRQKGAWIDAVSLLMCTVVLVFYQILESHRLFGGFKFSALFDPSTMAGTYHEMVEVGRLIEDQRIVIAFNLLLVAIRAVVLVAELQSNFGLILEVLDCCSSALAYFLVMFLLIMTGFVLMAYFIFGFGAKEFSSPTLAFITTFTMLTGEEVFDKLAKLDGVMAFIFFYSFYILFYLVFINVFVSILMAGYDAVVVGHKENEDGFLTKLLEDLKHEFLDRIVAWGKVGLSYFYRIPLCDSCMTPCSRISSCSMPNWSRWFSSGPPPSPTDDDDGAPARPSGGASTKERKAKHPHAPTYEWVSILIFLLTDIVFLILQVRSKNCYDLVLSTAQDPLQQSYWVGQNPYRVEDMNDVMTFSQVRQWSTSAIVDMLYGNNMCAIVDEKTGVASIIPANGPTGCNNTKSGEQLVQTIHNWNIGFMNTTFVRLTIQPACFVANDEPTWQEGIPLLRKTPDTECHQSDCTSVLKDYSCTSPDGVSFSPGGLKSIPVGGSGTDFYNYSEPNTELGAYQMRGGFVVSLGVTAEEAKAKLSMLEADQWFTAKSASMVFDWITYNGNMDLFNYISVGWDLRASGRMTATLSLRTFPMNIAGGAYSTQRTWILILFSFYIFMVLCQCLEIARRIFRTTIGKSCKKAIFDWFGDFWNISDSVSLVMAILAIVYFMTFALNTFRTDYKFSVDGELRYQIPNNDEKEFSIPRTTQPGRALQEDWYIFYRFEQVESMYGMFLTVSALNCFLIAIKVVKYVGQMDSVRVFSDTLDKGKTRNGYFAVVILLLMCGFALWFHILFGEQVDELNSPSQSVITLFKWMIGEFNLRPLLHKWEFLTTSGFIIFMVTFYYIATNMFLATMLTVYCDKLGAEDEEKAKQKYRPRKEAVIHYADRRELLEDIRADNLELREGEVFVRDFKKDTQPGIQEVAHGHILAKVNGETKLWKEHCKSVQEILDRLPDEGEIHLEFVERVTKKEHRLKRVMRMIHRKGPEDESDVSVKATCKNFWRMEGAVGCIAREARNQEGGDDDKRMGEGGEGGLDDDEDEAKEDSDSDEDGRKTSDAVKLARRRLRTKKRLDALLFSRWSDGKPNRGMDGAEGTGHAWEHFGGGGSDDMGGQPKEIQYEVEGVQVFALREMMSKLQVVGQEAWLDCLVSSIERLMDDDSVISDVLRTSEMQDLAKNKPGREQKPVQEFYRHADQVLKMLEYKANKKYYQYLQMESEQRQEHLRSQNEVLHDYVCELETEFTKVMELIHENRSKKEVMLTKLSGLLDRTTYRHLDKSSPPPRPAMPSALEGDEDDMRLANSGAPDLRDM